MMGTDDDYYNPQQLPHVVLTQTTHTLPVLITCYCYSHRSAAECTHLSSKPCMRCHVITDWANNSSWRTCILTGTTAKKRGCCMSSVSLFYIDHCF
jgi:hypothetical protein